MGDNTTEKTETRDPWAPAQPYITDVLGKAKSLYDSGAGTAQWGGSVLSGLDPRTMEAMRSTEMTARNSNTTMPFQFGNNLIGSGGITPQMAGPMGIMGGVAGGRNGIRTGGDFEYLMNRANTVNAGPGGILNQFATSDPISTGGAYGDVASRARNSATPGMLNDLYTRSQGQNAGSTGILDNPGSISTAGDYRSVGANAGGPTAADSYLTDMAKGGQENPYLQSMLDANAARVSNRVNSSISGAGRTGSFAHGDALVRSIAEANNPLLAAAYDADRNRMLSASGQIDSSRRAADATQLAALSGQTGVEGANIGNRMDAAGRAAGIRQGDTQLGAGILGQGAGIGAQNFATELSALGGMTGVQGQNAATRIGAAGALADSNRADISTSLGATQGLTGVQGQNIANQLGASQGLLGAYGQGLDRSAQWASMAPQNYAFQNAPAQDIGRIGEYNQARSQAELDAERQRFEQSNMMPWTQLGRYSSAGLGAVAPYAANAGTTTSTTTQESDPLRTIAGLGIAGASMFMNPMGSVAGMIPGMNGYNPFAGGGNMFPSNPGAAGFGAQYVPGYGYAPMAPRY